MLCAVYDLFVDVTDCFCLIASYNGLVGFSFSSCVRIFQGMFQDKSSQRLRISANSNHGILGIDCPLIEHRKDKHRRMEVQDGSHAPEATRVRVARRHMHDWLILILLVVTEVVLNHVQPFYRFIGQNMMTDLKFPLKSNTVPFWVVPVYAVLLPLVIFLIFYCRRRDIYDLHHGVLGLVYSLLVTAVFTDSMKIAVGRPRPNFFWRCFPDGKDVYDKMGNVICHGNKNSINEGHKSFPSGHTSLSFAGMMFLSLYLSGKIKAFNRGGHIGKLCIVILPLLVATFVGISRVDDYWHHWQDVFIGGLLGLIVATFCYLQFFPPPYHPEGWGPYAYFQALRELPSSSQAAETTESQAGDATGIQSEDSQMEDLESGRR